MAVLKGYLKAQLEPDMINTKKALQDFLNSTFPYNSTGVIQDVEFFRCNKIPHKVKTPQYHDVLAVIAVVVDVLDVWDARGFKGDITDSLEKSATQDKVYFINAELKPINKGLSIFCYFSYDPLDFTLEASKC